jgi:hypothetical protein
MGKMVIVAVRKVQAFRAWVYNKTLRTQIIHQVQELNQSQRTKSGRILIAVGATLATWTSQAAAQTFNTATAKIQTEGTALATNITTILGVCAVIAFLIGIGMIMFRQRGGWYALAAAAGSLVMIPITKALPALAK